MTGRRGGEALDDNEAQEAFRHAEADDHPMTLATLSTGQHAVVAVLFAATLLALVLWSCRCVPTHPDEDAVLRSACDFCGGLGCTCLGYCEPGFGHCQTCPTCDGAGEVLRSADRRGER
jgi:hypothetical protein